MTSADYFANVASGGNANLEQVLHQRLTARRSLDRGNARPETLTDDFALIGLPLWPALGQADRRSPLWKDSLDKLNQARNAIAHVDAARLQGLQVTLTVVRKWRRDLDHLATCMNDVVSAYLDQLLGQGRPW